MPTKKELLSLNRVATRAESPTVVVILTREEAAARLRMAPSQISELTRKRARDPLPYVKFGKAVRFVAADVDAWIHRQRGTGK